MKKPVRQSDVWSYPCQVDSRKKAKLPARIDIQSVRAVSIWLGSAGSYKSRYILPQLAEFPFLIYTV